jgi:outer membrane protein insertion porin family
VALALFLVPVSSGLAETSPKAGMGRVAEIEVRWEGTLGRTLNPRALIAFMPGIELTDAAVRRTLSNFYSTGLFSEVEVFTRPATHPISGEEEGTWVTAVVLLRGIRWAHDVRLVGNLGLKRRALTRVLRQAPNTPLDSSRISASRDALEDLYSEYGYAVATVQVELQPMPESHRIEVIYHLESGPRARVGNIRFRGDLGEATAAQLRQTLRTRTGKFYRRKQTAEDADRLRSGLAKQGHLQAEVGIPRQEYDATTHSIDLIFPVHAGPVFKIEVLGVPEQRLRRQESLTVLREHRFDAAQLTQDLLGVKDFYQRRGLYRAAPRFSLQGEGTERQLVIDIDLGEPFELVQIHLVGNGQVADEELLELLSTSLPRRFNPNSGRLVSQVLEEDLANLRSFYLLEGFLDVEIGPVVVTESNGELTITLPIQEGVRRRLVNFEFSGTQHFSGEELRAKLPLRRGGPFHPALLNSSLNILRTLYEDEGYSEPTIEPMLDWNAEGTLVDLTLQVREGPRSEVDRVIFRGHRRSRPEAIQRLLGFKSGDVISRRHMLQAERELYRLGIYSRVDVEMAPLGDLDGRRDVLVDVEEGQQWRLAYGFSYHSEDGLGGLLSLSRVNLRGRGDRLQLDMRGNEKERRIRLILDQPTLLPGKLPITFTLFREEEKRDAFDVEETGAQVSITRDWPTLRLGFLYDYRLVNLSQGSLDTPLDIGLVDREDRELELSSITPNLFIDRRDDPLSPSRGWSTALELEYAFPFFAAEANFLKFFGQQTFYRPLGRFGTLAASLRLGAIEGLHQILEPDSLVPEGLPNSQIPASERFFAGGRTSHRAYERDALGIPDQTLIPNESGGFLEVGGNGLAVLNLDYRFPISGDFGGLVFFDWGNVWADWRDIDPADLKAGVGFGFRYLSPIGPVRLEMGWKLDRESFEEAGPVLLLSFGDPF